MESLKNTLLTPASSLDSFEPSCTFKFNEILQESMSSQSNLPGHTRIQLSDSIRAQIHQLHCAHFATRNDHRLLQSHSFISENSSKEDSQPTPNQFNSFMLSPVPSYLSPRLTNTLNPSNFPKESTRIEPKLLIDSSIEAPSLSESFVLNAVHSVVNFKGENQYTGSFRASGYLNTTLVQYSDTGTRDWGDLYLTQLVRGSISNTLRKLPVTWVTCGYHHCLLLTVEGTVMSWGQGQSGCLGLGNTLCHDKPTFIPALLNKSITYIEAGAYHNAAVSHSGALFTWGRGEVHQLGVPLHQLTKDSKGYLALSPIKNKQGLKVAGVACGEAHTLVLDSSGTVHSCGWGEDGQLGLCSTQNHHELNPITHLSGRKIVKVSAGSLFSACVDEQGEVFVWGCGAQGQLGLGPGVKHEVCPRKVAGVEQIVDLVCGEASVVCVSRDNEVFAWGVGVAGTFRTQDFAYGSELACFYPVKLLSFTSTHAIDI